MSKAIGIKVKDLIDHPIRRELFLEKYKRGDKFDLTAGGKAHIKYDRVNGWLLTYGTEQDLKEMEFKEDIPRGTKKKPRIFKFPDFKKTQEFRKIDPTRHEKDVAYILNVHIFNAGGSIDLIIGNKTYKGLTAALHVTKELANKAGYKANPKADILLCSRPRKPFENAVYISLKKPGKVQQYGGISGASKITKHISKSAQEEVDDFLRRLSTYIDPKLQRLPFPVWAPIKSDDLKRVGVFGYESPLPEKYSLQSVHMIGKGFPILLPRGKAFKLTFSEFTFINGERKYPPEYLPVFAATYRSDPNGKDGVRGFTIDGHRFGGARPGIYPYKWVKDQGSKMLEI